MHNFQPIKLTSVPPVLWQPHFYFQFLKLERVEKAGLAFTSDEEATPVHTPGVRGLSKGLSDQCATPQKKIL